MTRSVEIPEQAVEAALAAHYRQPVPEWKAIEAEEQMRSALLAALPYLAPAGDGGLRKSLEELGDWMGHNEGDWRLHNLLAAHPAAPAVPQPVDREALYQAISDAAERAGVDKFLEEEDIEAFTSASLAVLAGEQEQVQ